ncbi:hypothetical protein ACQF4J_32125 [Streptomyces sp. C1-1]|uniref:hypothetical protein n=1 Tax=Streptomyces sp. C1-1 TaxID=3231173 RepID=UPI003D05EC9D
MSDSDSSGPYYSAHSQQSTASHHSASSSGYPSSTGNSGQSYAGYDASASGYASDSEGSDVEDAPSHVGSSTSSSSYAHASQQAASARAQQWNTAAVAVPLAGQSIAQGMVAHYAGQGNDPATVRAGNAYGGTIGATAMAPMGAVAQQAYYAVQTHRHPEVTQPAFSPGIAAGNAIATAGWGAYGYGASGDAAQNGTAPYWQAGGAATAAVGHAIAGLSTQQMHYPSAEQQNYGPGLPQYNQQVDPRYLARQAAQQQGGGYGNSATQATQHSGRHQGQAAQRRGRGGGGGGGGAA